MPTLSLQNTISRDGKKNYNTLLWALGKSGKADISRYELMLFKAFTGEKTEQLVER